MDVREMISKASMKTGLFKRRMVHVARRFGAISRWVDFSNVSLRQLMKSFEGTVILDEALKETLEKDLDILNTIKILEEIRDGSAKIVVLKTKRKATPVARIGIERISRKTDLIPPEKMKRILLESARVRILNEVKTFLCISCREFVEMIRVKDLPEKFACTKCGSMAVAVLNESEEELAKIIAKRGRGLSAKERGVVEMGEETARLMEKYGRVAAYVLSGRRLTVEDAHAILRREKKVSDRLFELIIEGEKTALRRRFW